MEGKTRMADIEKLDISIAGKRSDDSVRPCPFCGSENIAVGSDKGTVYRHNTAFGDLTRSVPTVRWAYCVDCGCVAPAERVNNFDGFYKPDEQEDALNRAISAWNRRAQPANGPLTLKQPEMVRCEDCKYFTDKGVCTFYSVFKNDGSYLSMQFMDDDDFCSYGERKDGDSNDK